MSDAIFGYYGKILEVDLTSMSTKTREIPHEDIRLFVGGRGLGAKILWDECTPGMDPLHPDSPLLFMPGTFSGFPIPSSSRTCVVCKSPHTSAVDPLFEHSSTISYSNIGGFFGPEIRFAGYDGIMVKGKASYPVYLHIDGQKTEIRDARAYWGMDTDNFDKKFNEDLGDPDFKSLYIGQAGENMVPIASIMSTAARSAGRGGTGCVMGSKNLKAIAIKGDTMPTVAQHKGFLEALKNARQIFKDVDSDFIKFWREQGTAGAIESSSNRGTQAVQNYREGYYKDVEKIGITAAKTYWSRSYACYCCPLACKKSGVIRKGKYLGAFHDSPEYETGTMVGANLKINSFPGMTECIRKGDEYGIDIIAAGNSIGFLMECYAKGLIDKDFLDGIDLQWGNVEGSVEMIKKMALREGVGKLAGQGVKKLAEVIGQDSHKFAIHVKGHELAAWNVHKDPGMGLSYMFANRGACHLNGRSIDGQNTTAIKDSLAICLFASGWAGYPDDQLRELFVQISGIEWSEKDFTLAGERIFNLEKMFNVREGFGRADEVLPDRFFEDELTQGEFKGAVLNREDIEELRKKYYLDRGWSWDKERPNDDKLKELGLEFCLG